MSNPSQKTILASAISTITGRTNLETGLTHPNDMNAAKELFLRLHQAGEILTEQEINSYALQDGWKPEDAKQLAQLGAQIGAGKKPRIGDGPWWNDNIVDNLRAGLQVVAIFLCLLCTVGCKEKITGISCTVDEGSFVSDEVYFTNTSGKNLSDVSVTMTLTGINGAQTSATKFWSVWALGDRKEISLSIGNGQTVRLIQSIQLSGKANEGEIAAYWRYNNPHSR